MSDVPVEREGLPEDLWRILRDQSIIVPQDTAVFDRIAESKQAPTGTAAPLTAEEWERAWSVTAKRLLASEAQVEQLTKERDGANMAAVDYEAWLGAALKALGVKSIFDIPDYKAHLAAAIKEQTQEQAEVRAALTESGSEQQRTMGWNPGSHAADLGEPRW